MQYPKVNKQLGVTLLELSIALIIIGLFTAFGLTAYNMASAQKRIHVTEQNMNRVVSALSTYAESNSRIPCPSDPASPENPTGAQAVYGWERGVTYTQTLANTTAKPIGTCNGAGQHEGVVPFITLDLPYEASIDGWGRPFTYAVSPILTANNDQTALPFDSGTVHSSVRTASWVFQGDNVNAPKARFCGLNSIAPGTAVLNIVARDAGTGTDQRLVPLYVDSSSPTYSNVHDLYSRLISPGLEVAFDLPDIDAAPDRGANLIPAFALISHGPNGEGSYVVNNTNGRFGALPAGTLETENYNADFTYREQALNLTAGAANFFDDRVIWLTQDGLMAFNGKSSCSTP